MSLANLWEREHGSTPAERLDALPHGESADGSNLEASQAEMEERLQSEFEDFERGGQPLGVLWIAVDQGRELRKTHGAAACEAMIEKVKRALAVGLRPAEELGRWGDDEFLVDRARAHGRRCWPAMGSLSPGWRGPPISAGGAIGFRSP